MENSRPTLNLERQFSKRQNFTLTAIVLWIALGLGSAFAQDRPTPGSQPHGLSFGVRSGYGVPFGKSANSYNYSDLISGMVPFWGDLGYRFTPNFYFGGFFQYGLGFLPNTVNCAGYSCSVNDIRFGANLHYHFTPAEPFDPWVGIGGGYEIWNFNTSALNASVSLKGFEFGNAQAGLDFRGGPNFSVGPFVAFTISQFSTATGSVAGSTLRDAIQTKGIHVWLIFGLRAAFEFSSE